MSVFLRLLRFYFSVKPKAVKLFEKYSKVTSFKSYLGVQAEIQDKLEILLKTWVKEKPLRENETDKILIVVDDIDRCSEEKIINIIDSLRVMLENKDISKRVVVLAAVDGNVLIRAIKSKYYDMIDKDFAIKEYNEEKSKIAEKLSREYMDKLFLAGIKLGVLTESERGEIFECF